MLSLKYFLNFLLVNAFEELLENIKFFEILDAFFSWDKVEVNVDFENFDLVNFLVDFQERPNVNRLVVVASDDVVGLVHVDVELFLAIRFEAVLVAQVHKRLLRLVEVAPHNEDSVLRQRVQQASVDCLPAAHRTV